MKVEMKELEQSGWRLEEKRFESRVDWKSGQLARLKLKEAGRGLAREGLKGIEMEIGRWSEPREERVDQVIESES